MNEMKMDSKEDDNEEELKTLQRANENRWDELQKLHQQYVQLSSSETPADTATAFLQAERDILCQYGAATRECDTLLDEIEDKHSGEHRFGFELVEKCNQLHELELLFQEKIQFQKEIMDRIDHSIKEQVILQKKLKELQSHLLSIKDTDNTEDTKTDQQENKRLRDDLAYLAGLVAPTENIAESQKSWSLNELMIHLLERYIASPDEPYLSCREGNIQKEHVEILKNSWLIETFDQDDSMIRLTDYTQEE